MSKVFCHYCGKHIDMEKGEYFRYTPNGFTKGHTTGYVQGLMAKEDKDKYDIFCCKDCRDKGMNGITETINEIPDGFYECDRTDCMNLTRKDGYRVSFCTLPTEKAKHCMYEGHYTPIRKILCPICNNPFDIRMDIDASKEEWYEGHQKHAEELGCKDLHYGQVMCTTCNRQMIFSLDYGLHYDKGQQLEGIQEMFALELKTDASIVIRTDGTGNPE